MARKLAWLLVAALMRNGGGAANVAWPQHALRTRATAPPLCHGGACSSLAHYPVRGTLHYAEFNVPELPKKIGPTWFAYYNIDWQAAAPNGSDARMNQFVPQLMLGHPLDGTTGPPHYNPLWHERSTWCFGAQYFFEIFNASANSTSAHAATGETYNCTPVRNCGLALCTEPSCRSDR